VYLAGIVVGVAAFALSLPAWVSVLLGAASILGGALLAAAWLKGREVDAAVERPGPSTDAPATAVFMLEGEYWTIALDGPPIRMADSKGLRYIHRLLQRPGVRMHAVELERLDHTTGRPTGPDTEGLSTDWPSDQPLIDEQALDAYRRRADELREEIEEAERNIDPERASAARQQLAALVDEIRRAQRPGGKVGTMPGPVDRSRVNVTRTIRNAISKIRDKDDSLGHHLDREIHTGTYCVYDPDPRSAPNWLL